MREREKVKPMKIIRVDKNEFETEDGQIFEHPVPLDVIPTVEEFQKIHDACTQSLNDLLQKEDLE